MAINYFQGATTLAELKKAYRDLARQYHPDLASADDRDRFNTIMAQINDQYDRLVKTAYKSEAGEKYSRENEETEVLFKEVLMRLALLESYDLQGLTAEIIGTWLWISGKGTYAAREVLKELGFNYATGKKSWYLTPHGKPAKRRFAVCKTLDEVKKYHNSTEVRLEGKGQRKFA